MKSNSFTRLQLVSLVMLRWFIGWHFLYEGIIKAMNPSWSAVGYLLDSKGPFSTLFHSIATNPDLLAISNTLNIAGLILIGLSLILGILSRAGAIAGICLLILYVTSHPSLIGISYMLPMEGSYIWIDKNIIEAVALLVIFAFPTSKIIGLDHLWEKFRKNNHGK